VEFFAGVQIVAALPDTCYDVYRINGSGYYEFYTSGYMDKAYSINEFFLNINDDTSNIYINSSRPVTVLSGVSCGNIPVRTAWCDHMVETIPPISELGLTHVVPPIMGRTAAAGYLVRVIATQPATSVTWTQTDGTVTTGISSPGAFYEIGVTDCSQPILIVCSLPCLVMQYNRGLFIFSIIPHQHII
jgi:hypothetical protein